MRNAEKPSAEQPPWYRLAALLPELAFGVAVRLRSVAFQRGFIAAGRLPGHVISVGNLTLGGTGKSPIIILLAKALLARGKRPAILTRGYGSGLPRSDSMVMINDKLFIEPKAPLATNLWPDEARMQSVALPYVPVICGAKRMAAARRFLERHPEMQPTHWLLDDGFQHRRVARDTDIVLLDAKSPFGNGRLLPRGTLREGAHALGRASVVVFTRATAAYPTAESRALVRRFAPTAGIATASFMTSVPSFDSKVHGPALVATGIAGPETLARELTGQRLPVAHLHAVPDHGHFDRLELLRLLDAHRAQSVVTTAKDYWRDPELFRNLPKPTHIATLTVDLPDLDLSMLLTACKA